MRILVFLSVLLYVNCELMDITIYSPQSLITEYTKNKDHKDSAKGKPGKSL